MNKLLLILGIILMGGILAIGANPSTFANEEEEEIEEQQFLFMMEEAYTQERGEWQVSFTTQYMHEKKLREVEYEDGEKEEKLKLKDEWQWIAEIEYGILDWLQVEVEIPFINVDKRTIKESDSQTITDLDKTGVGDIEGGIGIRLVEEDEGSWWLPTATFGFEVKFPTGSWKEDRGTNHYGFETGLALSKIIDKFVIHLNVSSGYTESAREEGESEKVDEKELECGIALVYRPTDRLDLICEAFAEFEEENNPTGYNYETEVYVTPGIRYELFKDFEIGVGVPIGLTYESHDWGIISKAQYEW